MTDLMKFQALCKELDLEHEAFITDCYWHLDALSTLLVTSIAV